MTIPLVLPGLASGAVLSFARSLGEFGATLTFAGSLQGVTRTPPLEIYLQRESDADAAVALSLVLVVIAILVVAAYPRAAIQPMTLTMSATLASRGLDVDFSIADGERIARARPERGREIHPAGHPGRHPATGQRTGRTRRTGFSMTAAADATDGCRHTAVEWP